MFYEERKDRERARQRKDKEYMCMIQEERKDVRK
jgi:hypothetical protein